MIIPRTFYLSKILSPLLVILYKYISLIEFLGLHPFSPYSYPSALLCLKSHLPFVINYCNFGVLSKFKPSINRGPIFPTQNKVFVYLVNSVEVHHHYSSLSTKSFLFRSLRTYLTQHNLSFSLSFYLLYFLCLFY